MNAEKKSFFLIRHSILEFILVKHPFYFAYELVLFNFFSNFLLLTRNKKQNKIRALEHEDKVLLYAMIIITINIFSK